MRKWVALILIFCFLFPVSVSAFPAVPPDHDGYVDGYEPDSPVEQEERKIDPSIGGGLIDRVLAAMVNGLTAALRYILGGISFDSIIFAQANPITGQPFQGNSVGAIFSADEWNHVVNPLRISLSVVAWMFFAVSIAYYGLKVMKDSTNPLKQIDLREKLLAYIGAAAMLAFMHMIFFLLAKLNFAFVNGMYGLIKENEIFQRAFSVIGVLDVISVFEDEGPMTELAFFDSLINLMLACLLIWLVFQYIFRKFIIGVLVVIAPFAAWSFARNRDGMAFKLWLAELTSQIFIQTAHALVIVLYVGFLSNSLGTDQLRASVSGVLDPILQFLIGIAGVIAAGALMWNFLRLAFSGRNPKGRYLAIQGVKYSLIGFFISAGALIVLNLIRGMIF